MERIVYEFPANNTTWNQWQRERPEACEDSEVFHTQVTQVTGAEPKLYKAVFQRKRCIPVVDRQERFRRRFAR